MRRLGPTLGCLIVLTALVTTNAARSADEFPIRLVDVTATSGIEFRHTDGGSGQGYIVEGVSAGLALFDYNGDDLIDIFFLNGGRLQGSPIPLPPRDALYRNNGDWTFTDVTDQAGVGDLQHGLGVTVGDYDGDRDPDLYLNNFGRNALYRNNGNGTFSDVTNEAGVADGEKVGAGACFFDMDGDQDLDLYVANYVDFTYENHVPIIVKGQHFKAGPQYYRPVADTLFRNNGDGTFTDVSLASGIGSIAGPGMGVIALDYDEDGHTDVFVCNDGKPNFLFRNDGHGKFTESGIPAGVAYNFQGKAISSMGVDCADWDNDGHLDLFVTSYQSDMPVLFRNLGGGLFEDATSTARITHALFPHVHWGIGGVDFDNDGDRDIFIACGHFDPVELIDDRTAQRIRNFLLMNDGRGKFSDVSKLTGSGLEVVESSRGAAFDDLDNDGDVDAVILNSNALPTLLRNESPRDNHWLQIQLDGTRGNTMGVGARVRLKTGDLTQVAQVHCGRGYQSHWGTRLHFGLGQRTQVDQLEVLWPEGKKEIFPRVAIDRLVRLREGSGEGNR